MLKSIFQIDNQHLEALSPADAVEAFRDLLWAEATSVGIAKNLINVPSAITVDDGGVDAEVQGVEVAGGPGIIKPGLTRYQIKTGSFGLSGDAEIREILFNKGGTLKPRVKSCLDARGTLVIVLFGWDNPDRTDEKGVVAQFRAFLKSVNESYEGAEIEVWRQNNLIGYRQIRSKVSILRQSRRPQIPELSNFYCHPGRAGGSPN